MLWLLLQEGQRVFAAIEETGRLPEGGNTEIWSRYPDDSPKRSLYAGVQLERIQLAEAAAGQAREVTAAACLQDSRLAMVPILAHQAFGDSFKWMAYGDDDTVFFASAAANAVRDLDPEQPLFLSGKSRHGRCPAHAPSALPSLAPQQGGPAAQTTTGTRTTPAAGTLGTIPIRAPLPAWLAPSPARRLACASWAFKLRQLTPACLRSSARWWFHMATRRTEAAAGQCSTAHLLRGESRDGRQLH